MNKPNLIKLSLKNSFTKKSIVTIILTSLTLSLIMFTMLFHKTLKNYWSDSITKLVDYRTFFVYYDYDHYEESDAIKKLKQHNHVESVSPFSSYLITMISNDYNNSKKNNAFFLLGVNKNPIKVYKGKNLESYNKDDKVMICADKFYPYQDTSLSNSNPNDAIDLTNKIDKNLSLSFIDSKKEEKFKLIGVYDSKLNKTSGNICYTNAANVSKLNLYYQSDLYNQNDVVYPLILTIDSVKNNDKTLAEIKKDGFYTNGAVLGINTETGEKIINIMKIITFTMLIVTIIIMIVIHFKRNKDDFKQYGLYKALGIRNYDLYKIYYIKNVIHFFIISIISILLCLIYMYFFNNLFLNTNLAFNGMQFKMNKIFVLIFIFFYLIVSNMFIYFYLKCLNRKKIIDLLKE